MKVPPERLARQLQDGLAPVYVLGGDEPLLLEEAASAIRSAARAAGFEERETFFADAGFDWRELAAQSQNLSLFSQKRLLEVRLPGGKPGAEGARVLSEYAREPAEDTVLMLLCGRLESAARNSAWYKALDQAGVSVQAWPLGQRELPGWLQNRARGLELELDREATGLLAERVEGNLLAANQALERLALLYPGQPVDAAAVLAVVADNARFDVFGWVDALLAGESRRALRALENLQHGGAELPLLLWALTRDLRLVCSVSLRVTRGESPRAAMQALRVWQRRQTLIESAVRRMSLRRWHACLARAARCELMAKGALGGNGWEEMLQLTRFAAASKARRQAS